MNKEKMDNKQLRELCELCGQWAKNRLILDESTAIAQEEKGFSEVAELIDANTREERIDAIGDILVCYNNVTLIKHGSNLVETLKDQLVRLHKIEPNCDTTSVEFYRAKLRKLAGCLGELLLSEQKSDKPSTEFEYNMIDILNMLSIFAKIDDTTLEECLQSAYDEIKDRKGLMFEGKYVKSTSASFQEVFNSVWSNRPDLHEMLIVEFPKNHEDMIFIKS